MCGLCWDSSHSAERLSSEPGLALGLLQGVPLPEDTHPHKDCCSQLQDVDDRP